MSSVTVADYGILPAELEVLVQRFYGANVVGLFGSVETDVFGFEALLLPRKKVLFGRMEGGTSDNYAVLLGIEAQEAGTETGGSGC